MEIYSCPDTSYDSEDEIELFGCSPNNYSDDIELFACSESCDSDDEMELFACSQSNNSEDEIELFACSESSDDSEDDIELFGCSYNSESQVKLDRSCPTTSEQENIPLIMAMDVSPRLVATSRRNFRDTDTSTSPFSTDLRCKGNYLTEGVEMDREVELEVFSCPCSSDSENDLEVFSCPCSTDDEVELKLCSWSVDSEVDFNEEEYVGKEMKTCSPLEAVTCNRKCDNYQRLSHQSSWSQGQLFGGARKVPGKVGIL